MKGGRHVFTVDVEEHFQVHALEGVVDRASWDRRPSRVEGATDRLLEMLAEGGDRATFFVLGWVARRSPGLVRRIAAAGHEVASHGMDHRRVDELGPEGFRRDARTSRALLEDLAGARVRGYRAPSFSLWRERDWALEVLLEEGYRYDSSCIPTRRPALSSSTPPGVPHLVPTPSGPILEVPVTPLERAGLTLPAGGGAYFRHLPYGLTRSVLRDAGARGRPGVFYLHPWELDPDQPRLPASPITRLRHYGGLERVAPRLRRLLGEFDFGSVEGVYAMDAGGDPDVAPADAGPGRGRADGGERDGGADPAPPGGTGPGDAAAESASSGDAVETEATATRPSTHGQEPA